LCAPLAIYASNMAATTVQTMHALYNILPIEHSQLTSTLLQITIIGQPSFNVASVSLQPAGFCTDGVRALLQCSIETLGPTVSIHEVVQGQSTPTFVLLSPNHFLTSASWSSDANPPVQIWTIVLSIPKLAGHFWLSASQLSFR